MKICMVLEWEYPFDPRVKKEAKSLIAAGHEVHLLCVSHDLKKQPMFEDCDGVTVDRSHWSRRAKGRKSALQLRFGFGGWHRWWERRIGFYCRYQDFDVIHCHDIPLIKPVSQAAKSLGIHVVLDLHENYPESVRTSGYANTWIGRRLIDVRKWWDYEAEWLPKADRVVVETQELANLKGLDNAVVVPNYTDIDALPTDKMAYWLSDWPDYGKDVILHVGGISPNRGLDFVIRAMPRVISQHSNAHFVLVGKGLHKKTLEALVADLGLKKHVTFLGHQPHRILPALMHVSKVGIATHIDNSAPISSPNKITDYMYARLPTIAPRETPAWDLIQDSQSGLEVDPRDATDIASKILTLLRNPLLFVGGHSAVEEKYNWGEAVKPLLEMYDEMGGAN